MVNRQRESPVDAAPESFEQTVRSLLLSPKLRFPSILERMFRIDYHQRSIVMVRIALAVGLVLYTSFGILDAVLAPRVYRTLWIIRFAWVNPVLVAVLILSFTPVFRSISQLVLCAAVLSMGLGIVLMMVYLGQSEVALSYYAGLILVLMGSYSFTRIFFVNASIIGGLIVVSYWIASVFFQGVLEDPQTVAIFLSNNFFFMSANIIGMIVSYLFERSARKEFLHRQLLAENQRTLERERNELRRRTTIIEDELDMARSIQQALVPQDVPMPSMAAVYRPMEAIGGDYFDFFELDGKVGIFVCDVAGHGVPAALVASMVKSLIASTTALLIYPARLLSYLNDVLVDQTRQRFVTAFYCIFDRESRSLAWSIAGQNPPLIIHDGTVDRIASDIRHVPLAFMDQESLEDANVAYRDYRSEIPANGKLLVYTDGLLEVPSKEDSTLQFGDVVDEVVVRLSNLEPREFIDALMEELVAFYGAQELPDDVCAICVDT